MNYDIHLLANYRTKGYDEPIVLLIDISENTATYSRCAPYSINPFKNAASQAIFD